VTPGGGLTVRIGRVAQKRIKTSNRQVEEKKMLNLRNPARLGHQAAILSMSTDGMSGKLENCGPMRQSEQRVETNDPVRYMKTKGREPERCKTTLSGY
jgi:hypothetical protein